MVIDTDQLRYQRTRQALSLRDLAALSGVSRDTIRLCENGERDPHPRTIRQLSQALGIDPESLILWDDAEGDTA